jgi:NAD(P)-dependent dehydrogenase (short-subunit alcohol dehydrogenase family)
MPADRREEPVPIALEGKRAFVTGGADGIGEATVRMLVTEGARVAFADINADRGRDLERALNGATEAVKFLEADVSTSGELARCIAEAEAWAGGLDIIHNNAGIELGAGRRLTETTEDDFDRLVAVNLKGVFLGMKHGIAALERAGGGAVVNTASLAGLSGVPGFSAYSATKGAVVALTRTAALEYAPSNIRVNCVCPGYVVTSMTERLATMEFDQRLPRLGPAPMGRGASPDEIAAAVVFLASDRARFITGVALPVDGGSFAG